MTMADGSTSQLLQVNIKAVYVSTQEFGRRVLALS